MTIDLAESSSLVLSKQSDRDGDLRGHFTDFSEQGLCTNGGGNHEPWPRHQDTRAGATPTTIANPSRTIITAKQFNTLQ
ncbi:jg1026 [Pararge aegeria aegeria]|uniref:Jg1026 protein n=1 Tax=Pararge aegeria aegeria TaxID=348720 RepID=A0A8S4SKM9_9NEOP|nr:jg1026 [Pararge aegeria aegeria]